MNLKQRWNKANKAEKIGILKKYYPEIISKLRMEAQTTEATESTEVTDADSFMKFLKAK